MRIRGVPARVLRGGLMCASLAMAACSTTNATVGKYDVIVRDSMGGSVDATFAKYRGWQSQGKRIVIDGRVQSADAFAAFSMGNVCYTKNAVFSPHAASTMGLVPNYAATDRLARGLPKPLEKEFRSRAAYYNWVTTAHIDYEELIRIWPEGACSAPTG